MFLGCYYIVQYITSLLVHFFFFFNDTATTEIYTLSLHDALPISRFGVSPEPVSGELLSRPIPQDSLSCYDSAMRSEEHTSELQSPCNLVCRLLLEKKKIANQDKRRALD